MWGSKLGKVLWESLTVATRRDAIQQVKIMAIMMISRIIMLNMVIAMVVVINRDENAPGGELTISTTKSREQEAESKLRPVFLQGYDDHSEIRVEKIDGLAMVRQMAMEVQMMMQRKINAVKRIMEQAENIALEHKYDKDRGERLKKGRYSYYNAKKLNVLPEGKEEEEGANEYDRYLSQDRDQDDEYWAPGFSRMVLTPNKHFSDIPVNVSHSSVHVPTNVNDAEPEVINAIDWSRKLDDTFKDNFQRDPTLSWQFFGSSMGFLRQVCNLF